MKSLIIVVLALFASIPAFAADCAVKPPANLVAPGKLTIATHLSTPPQAFLDNDKPAIASSGAAVLPDFKLGSERELPDLLLVCAGGNPALFKDRQTLAWLRRVASRKVIMGGISGGPFVLARAGLLKGRRCTVHWAHAAAMHEEFPDIRLAHSLFELDGDRFTCSGGVAALDMMVALITRDHGYELGAAVADWFLHTHVREGRGPQRMDLRLRLGISDAKLLETLKAMEAHIESPLTRAELADIAQVSLRQLERSFRTHLGRGVHEHYLALRVARARQLLRETSRSILEVALGTGFASASQFSRAFRNVAGMTPTKARDRSRVSARAYLSGNQRELHAGALVRACRIVRAALRLRFLHRRETRIMHRAFLLDRSVLAQPGPGQRAHPPPSGLARPRRLHFDEHSHVRLDQRLHDDRHVAHLALRHHRSSPSCVMQPPYRG